MLTHRGGVSPFIDNGLTALLREEIALESHLDLPGSMVTVERVGEKLDVSGASGFAKKYMITRRDLSSSS